MKIFGERKETIGSKREATKGYMGVICVYHNETHYFVQFLDAFLKKRMSVLTFIQHFCIQSTVKRKKFLKIQVVNFKCEAVF